MGDVQEVIAHADIFESNGIKLVAKGARIDSRLFQRLTQHRRAAPLDSMLTAKHPVNTHSLVVELDSIIKHEAVYRRILTRTGDPHAMKPALASVRLAPEVMLRLTLMRECRPDASIVNVLRDLLHITTNDAQEMRLARNATAQVEHITALLETWITLRGIIKQEADPAKPDTTALTFLFERMATMRSLILQAGFDPESMASMLVIAQDDPDMLRELHRMLDELESLASYLTNQIDRRSPELSPLVQGALNGLLVQLSNGTAAYRP